MIEKVLKGEQNKAIFFIPTYVASVENGNIQNYDVKYVDMYGSQTHFEGCNLVFVIIVAADTHTLSKHYNVMNMQLVRQSEVLT